MAGPWLVLRVDRGEPSRRPRACRQEPGCTRSPALPKDAQPRTFWKPCSPEASGGWPGPARPLPNPLPQARLPGKRLRGSSPGPVTASQGPVLPSCSSHSADPREARGGGQWGGKFQKAVGSRVTHTQRLSSLPRLRPTRSRALAAALLVGDGMASPTTLQPLPPLERRYGCMTEQVPRPAGGAPRTSEPRPGTSSEFWVSTHRADPRARSPCPRTGPRTRAPTHHFLRAPSWKVRCQGPCRPSGGEKGQVGSATDSGPRPSSVSVGFCCVSHWLVVLH